MACSVFIWGLNIKSREFFAWSLECHSPPIWRLTAHISGEVSWWWNYFQAFYLDIVWLLPAHHCTLKKNEHWKRILYCFMQSYHPVCSSIYFRLRIRFELSPLFSFDIKKDVLVNRRAFTAVDEPQITTINIKFVTDSCSDYIIYLKYWFLCC